MAIYFGDDLPEVGSRVHLTLAGEVVQRYVLIGIKEHTTKAGKDTHVLTWETPCTDCGEAVRFTSGPTTGNMYRRCKPCRVPYNTANPVRGWPSGPRIRHVLLDPEEGYEAPVSEAIEVVAEPRPANLLEWAHHLRRDGMGQLRWKGVRYGEMNSATVTLALAVAKAMREAGVAIESDEIDPASLF